MAFAAQCHRGGRIVAHPLGRRARRPLECDHRPRAPGSRGCRQMMGPTSMPSRPESSSTLIALDWGTSTLRAHLPGAHGEILETRTQPWGIMRTPNGDFAQAFRAVTNDWQQRAPHLPAI